MPPLMDICWNALEELVPHGGHNEKEIWTSYLPHAIYVIAGESTLDETIRAPLLDGVGRCQVTLGQYAEAEMTHLQVLSLREKVFGEEHPSTLASMNEVGVALNDQGKYEEAEAMYRQTLATKEKALGKGHPDALTCMNNLALVPDNQGKYEKAESMNRQKLALCEKVLGPEHPDRLTSVYCLAHLLANRQRYDDFVVLYERHALGIAPP